MEPSNENNHKDWYLSNFKTFENGLNGESKTPFHQIRRDAISRFEEFGFPTNKNEDWKYTSVAPILKYNFTPAFFLKDPVDLKKEIGNYFVPGLPGHVLVFINGSFAKEFSSLPPQPDGIRISSMASALANDNDLILPYLGQYAKVENGFNALNTAFARDGAFIHIPEGRVLEEPIFLLFLSGSTSTPVLAQPRNLIHLGKNSQVKIVESYQGFSHQEYFTNSITEIILEENSQMKYYKIQDEKSHSFHVSKTQVEQNRNSNFTSYTFSFDGALIRNDLNTVLNADGTECNLYGLYVTRGDQHVDNHTLIDHAKPQGTSYEFYKGILGGASRGVFNGKILVKKDAQKTNAYQSNKNLLLSEEAFIDTKPQLEIFADDVKCSHGATIGQLEEDPLFYLQSRGVEESIARAMLISAFASDLIDIIKSEPLENYLNHKISERMKMKFHLDKGIKCLL